MSHRDELQLNLLFNLSQIIGLFFNKSLWPFLDSESLSKLIMKFVQIISHLFDFRNPLQIFEARQWTLRNDERILKKFKISLTQKSSKKYGSSSLKKAFFPQGNFCYFTDNQLYNKTTILTVHGCPGNHKEWSGLEHQMNQTVRWINFIVPGFDNEDQRRGSYYGSNDDLCQLINNLLDSLKIIKFIFCGHSMGSIFMTYYASKFSDRILGLVSITGIVDQWYIGLKTFYTTIVTQNRDLIISKESLDEQGVRSQIYARVSRASRQINFSGVPFPKLTSSQIMAYIKLMTSYQSGLSQVFSLNLQMRPQILQLLIFGRSDPIEDSQKVQKLFYRKARQFQSSKLFQQARHILFIETGIDFQQNLQKQFMIFLKETGHNAHKRRPAQISKLMRYFVRTCQIVGKQ